MTPEEYTEAELLLPELREVKSAPSRQRQIGRSLRVIQVSVLAVAAVWLWTTIGWWTLLLLAGLWLLSPWGDDN